MNIKKKTKQKPKIRSGADSRVILEKAREYDELVRTLLRDTSNSSHRNTILMFNYRDGFIAADIQDFAKYSVRP